MARALNKKQKRERAELQAKNGRSGPFSGAPQDRAREQPRIHWLVEPVVLARHLRVVGVCDDAAPAVKRAYGVR